MLIWWATAWLNLDFQYCKWNLEFLHYLFNIETSKKLQVSTSLKLQVSLLIGC